MLRISAHMKEQRLYLETFIMLHNPAIFFFLPPFVIHNILNELIIAFVLQIAYNSSDQSQDFDIHCLALPTIKVRV